MSFVKTDMIKEARELQKIFKDDSKTREMFYDFELKHIETEKILEELQE